ncbi:tripartite tricarboxylate transporter substrate binding protein [Xylophilus rhododendri]|uniref:Tripartite tricarboxylate transporter substrate binding protein n=1 Tax=Xylophilus rhododendri TaxID=2697032 RepID=A0A857JAQ3_9BURK|nr:tripartite tricarboxylate transporter substrate binding protein [Xylophilus rhododendri]QHJ00222.1 tripartite tricarboxylate transporter substrate binding protein [Xylophilus rhododendri]
MKNQNPKRRLALLSAVAACLASGLPAMAQTSAFPTRPIRLIVPFGPGTSTDTVTRVVADAMGRSLGQPLVVENRAGGGGTIGTDLAARAPADGYTLVMGTVGTHAINKTLYRKLSYDPIKDFAPIALVGQTPTLLVVGAGSPLQSLQDLAAAAKKAPGLGFASAGSGTSGHLAGELLKQKLGGEMVHVPYKEGGLALSDVMSGQVDFMFYHPAAVLPQIKAGKLRALGASGAQRSAAAPNVPTVAEQVGGGFDLVAWFMLYAPSGTPAPVLARLREAGARALADADVQAKLQGQGVEKGEVPARDLAAFSQREVAKWAELVKVSGAQVD